MRVEYIKQEILQIFLPKKMKYKQIKLNTEFKIQNILKILLRDCRAEMNGIEDRFSQGKSMKQTILQHQIQVIQQDLDKMINLVRQFYNLIKNNDYLEFLFVNEILDDLHRELPDLRLFLGKMEGQQEILVNLNEIIWRRINERKNEEESI
ncbi:unnamed protein product [Paramecium sonneborni]|uniref:Uncharacterized protein n=1 Tax=Paramecium sonneborni TaxID=65129 RepID=A0A8S1RIE8_9CILI|nr:unnamed protein product [Paramecium sonneborni]